MPPEPCTPSSLSGHARECLRALAEGHLGERFSLGGALGLLHYLDYRTTHDVDAWWEEDVSREQKEEVVDVVRRALKARGTVRVRRSGNVISVELLSADKVVFSFQVANRSARRPRRGRPPSRD